MKAEAIVIIGGGPAGIAAALECRRQGFDPLVIEKERPGGLLLNANRVDNYPGFPDGVDGETLANSFVQQMERKEIRVVKQEVTGLDYRDDSFAVETGDGPLRAEYVIVASGTKAKTIEDIVTDTAAGDHVYHEVYPIRKVKGKKVVIIGAGDAAFDYALNLARNNEVIILNRNDEVRCAPHLWEKASASESICYYQNVRVLPPCEFKDDRLSIKCDTMCDRHTFVADYLLVAIGRVARLDFVTAELTRETENPGQSGRLFFVGDVKNGNFRQTGIAVGEGIMAAMKICRSLKEAP